MSEKSSKTGTIREQNRRLILQAAENTFVKNGFKGTSMQAIADAAELPKANVLYYFKNKQTLYTAVLEGISARWDASLDHLTEADDPAETLARYICTKVELSIGYPNASKIFATEIIQGAPHLQEHLRTKLRAWVKEKTRVMNSWIQQGKMQNVDTYNLIFLIWSSTQHYADFDTQILTVANKQEYDPEDVRNIKRFLCRMILTGCGLDVPDFVFDE